MADAIGEKTTFNVRHPVTTSILPSMLGAVVGGAAGYGATALSRQLAGDRPFRHDMPMLPTLAGASLGSLAGSVLTGLSRRNEMNRINHFFDEDAAEGKVKPKVPNLSLLSALALPGRGAHRSGQVEAYNAMKGNGSIEDQRGYMRDGLNTAITAGSVVPGFPAGFLALLQGYGQNAKTQLAASRLKEQEEEERSNPVQQVAKAAALKVIYGT
jgi:hypothetical protein